ncbi:O-methyltransferase [Desertimonas flava]|uniref:O-methyltransferase n=1 Tax=Desertimonas flava TaxID=2064846 RepID=UPI000E355841|nr:class I SAM-dependent methyltransferase [Desertimonas flava]
MASKSENGWLDAAIVEYVAARAAQPDGVLQDLRDETAQALGRAAVMQVSADQGALLTLLTGLTGATFAVEVGTFTGYSSISIARGLRPEGRLLCCDVSEEYTASARAAWDRAGLADRIELRIGPAADTLRSLPETEHIDVAFIDADKPGYATYWDELVPRVRQGGLLMVDNTLWSGSVADPSVDDETTQTIRAFNDKVAADERTLSYILPIADGLTVARKL